MLDQYSENSFQPLKVLCLWHRGGVLVIESHLDQQATTDIRKFSLTIGKLAVLYLVLGFAVVTNAPQTHVVDFWLHSPWCLYNLNCNFCLNQSEKLFRLRARQSMFHMISP